MKQIIDLRPVYDRLEERIRAHVILCWLALLLIRIIETTTGDTWNNVRRHLDRLHVGTFTGPAGTFRQRTATCSPSSPSPRRSRSSSSSPPDTPNDLQTLETRPRGAPRLAAQVTRGIRPPGPPNYVEPRTSARHWP
jgi:hypothetical protein